MVILGIHDGHNCGATLLKDGKIEASVCEERLTRVKNEVGYPELSVREVLSLSGVQESEVEDVVFASQYMHTADHLSDVSKWYKVGKKEQANDEKLTQEELLKNEQRRKAERMQKVIDQLGVKPEQISFVDHHLAHAAAAYFGSGFDFDKETLVLTCDGAGDNLSATVSIGVGDKMTRISATGRNDSLGKIYSRITFYLGLKPWEHEYKVMGLAPYADAKYALEVKEILDGYLKVSEDGLGFEAVGDLKMNYIYERLRKDLELKRFDAISGGVQMFTEELLTTWIKNAVKHTGISRVVCGGGVFMNVKANKLASEIDGIEEIFVFPSCGDESLSFGAVWLKSIEKGSSAEKLTKLHDIYLGRSYTNDEIESVLKTESSENFEYEFIEDIDKKVATLIAENNVVARFAGRMEWGARALGNRSILTNPKEWPNVERINSMIKMRDFWMPFAPSMIAEYSDDYIVNPKGIHSPYMMFAFDTYPEKSREILAAVHPRDKTARAQMVTREANPRYWSVIKHFYDLTGTSVVLNTSFNLHGYPLVMSPKDALSVFHNSGLKYLALENYLISKRA